MTDIELFQIIRPHIQRLSGCEQVLLYAQNKNAPKGSYASIQPRYRVDERGQANIYTRHLLDSQSIDIDVRPQEVITCVVEFFRDDAKTYANRLLQMDKRGDVVWPLFKHGFSIRNVNPVMDLTALQSSNYEQRARVELILWHESSSKYVENTIEAVEVRVYNEENELLAQRYVPEDYDHGHITPAYVNYWADRIYAASRLGF